MYGPYVAGALQAEFEGDIISEVEEMVSGGSMGADCASDASSIKSSSSPSCGDINLVRGAKGGAGTCRTSRSSILGFIGISFSRPVEDSSDSIAKFKKPALWALTDNVHLYSANLAW